MRITEHKIDGCLPPVQNFPAWEETVTFFSMGGDGQTFRRRRRSNFSWEETVKLFVGGDGHQDTTFQHLPHYGLTNHAIKKVETNREWWAKLVITIGLCDKEGRGGI